MAAVSQFAIGSLKLWTIYFVLSVCKAVMDVLGGSVCRPMRHYTIVLGL